MHCTLLRPAPLLALAALLLPVPEARPVRFAPAEGLTLTKRLTWGTELTTEEFALELGGETFDEGFGLVRDVEHVLAVEDTYRSVDDGRPTDLRRRYLEVGRVLEANDPGGEGAVQVAGLGRTTSDLQGHVVRFRWDEDAEEYERAFDEDDRGGLDEDRLAGLAEDLDLRAFLPPGEVEEGDTWEVDLAAVRALLAPGGELGLEPDDDRPDAPEESIRVEVPSVPVGKYLDELEGSLRCQLLAFEEEEGLHRAVIRIGLEVEAVDDVAGALAADDPDRSPYDRVARELSIFGEGELTWDLDAHHVAALELEAEVEQRLEGEWVVETPGVEMPAEMSSTERGTLRVTLALE